jgi:outer membrane protein
MQLKFHVDFIDQWSKYRGRMIRPGGLRPINYPCSFKGEIMTGIRLGCIIMVCALLFTGLPIYAADATKIGVIDFQKILEKSNAGKYAQTEINKRGKIMEAELKKKGEQIEENKKRLEREALVMSKEMREEKEREIRININDFKTLQQKYMREFKEFEGRIIQQIQQEVVKLVREMGRKEGYMLIVEKRSGEVVYTPQTVDITDKLIKNYDASFSSKSGKSKK